MNRGGIFFALSAAVLMACVCHASIIQTDAEVIGTCNGGTGIATAANLMSQGAATLGSLAASSNFSPYNSSATTALSILNNGSLSGTGANAGGVALDTSHTWTLTVTLNTTTNTKGYDITGITTISGWNVDYVNQKYEVKYTTASDTASFSHSLGTFTVSTAYTSFSGIGSSPTTLQIALTDDTGIIASNVTAIEFIFSPASWTSPVTASGYTAGTTYTRGAGYSEIEVFGTASTMVPEPSTTMMMLTSAVAGLFYALRKRQSHSK